MTSSQQSPIMRWFIWSVAIIWTLIFSYLLVQPEQQSVMTSIIPSAPPSLEREFFFTSLHFISFCFTAWIWCMALSPAREDRRVLIILGICLLIYGVGTELIQLQIPGRATQWGDILANVLGIIAGFALWFVGRTSSASTSHQQTVLRH